MDTFITEVFACGRKSPTIFARLCPTIVNLMARPWWLHGLPDGALHMTASYTAKTEAWATSAEYAAVKAQLRTLLAHASTGGLQMQGPGACSNHEDLAGVEGHLAAMQLGHAPRGPHCCPATNRLRHAGFYQG